MKLDYCFHTHTYRCGHAQGEDEQYVICALKKGINTVGFSDHVFLPGISQPSTRGEYSELKGYINSIKRIKEKYKNKVDVYLGFECEYFDEYLDYYKSLKKMGFDYLILGQHFIKKDNSLLYVRNYPGKENVESYLCYLEDALKSNLFTYIAHPDLFVTMLEEFDDYAEEVSKRICKLCLEYDMPLEININGMKNNFRGGLGYPDERFWKVVGQYGNKVVIGYDAHFPEFFERDDLLNVAFDWIKKYNLNLIDKNEILKNMKIKK